VGTTPGDDQIPARVQLQLVHPLLRKKYLRGHLQPKTKLRNKHRKYKKTWAGVDDHRPRLLAEISRGDLWIPCPTSAFHQQLTYKKTSVEMPRARASVVIVATRAKQLRRDIEKVREVGALRERATSSRPVLAAGCPPARTLFHGRYVARIVSRQARRARQPNRHFFVAALGDTSQIGTR
jgi:hypothetical protein